MSVLQTLQIGVGIFCAVALGAFVLTIVCGVPYVMIRAAQLGSEGSSQIRRLNYRLFTLAQRAFYAGFASLLLYYMIAAIRDG